LNPWILRLDCLLSCSVPNSCGLFAEQPVLSFASWRMRGEGGVKIDESKGLNTITPSFGQMFSLWTSYPIHIPLFWTSPFAATDRLSRSFSFYTGWSCVSIRLIDWCDNKIRVYI
jgi:hypothetical protein